MRQGLAKMAAIGALAAAPAVALADSTTYTDPSTDADASIQLKVSDGDPRKVKKVVADDLPYTSDDFCGPVPGGTGEITVKGEWRVKDNGDFRVVGQFDGGGDPLDAGQLNVVGNAGSRKVTGDVKFTYGKNGCQTMKHGFKATR